MPDKPKILGLHDVCSSRLFRVQEVQLRFSNGEERSYERLAGRAQPGGVIVVPLLDDNTVVMIREYAVGLEDYELTLTKGRVEPGEDIREAANRELKEEIGYGAKDLQLLKCLSMNPAYMQHQTQIVLARDLYPEKLEGDEPEPLEVEEHSLSNITELVARGDLCEARTIAALYLTRDYLSKDD